MLLTSYRERTEKKQSHTLQASKPAREQPQKQESKTTSLQPDCRKRGPRSPHYSTALCMDQLEPSANKRAENIAATGVGVATCPRLR